MEWNLNSQLTALKVKHCVIEGDNLDLAFPQPWEHNLAQRNLAAIWANYRALGYGRMIYTNTQQPWETVPISLRHC